MPESLSAKQLLNNREDFYDAILKELDNSTSDLIKLEEWRSEEFPTLLEKRYAEDGKLYITLDELKKLMEWKLKKGKFRPTLKKLIAQNDANTVLEISKGAFELILNSKDKKLQEDDYFKLIKQSLNILIKLRGVGPATASLILSCLNKITNLAPPFFSDESALVVFDSYGDSKSWIKLKYSLSEYLKYLKLFYSLNRDFKHDFTELENGAWSLYLKNEFDLKKHKREDDEDEDEKKEKEETAQKSKRAKIRDQRYIKIETGI